MVNESKAGSIAQVGPSNQTLVAAGYDYAGLKNSSGNVTFFATHGMVGISRTSDGGSTWTTTWPGQNRSWASSASIDYGDVLSGLLPLFDYGMPNLDPAIVANSSGNETVVLAPYNPSCFYTGCTNQSQYLAGSGVAAIFSSDGGATWREPIPLSRAPWFIEAYWGGGCNLAAGWYLAPHIQTSSLALAMQGASGRVYAAWTTIKWTLGSHIFQCGEGGGSASFNFSGVSFNAYRAESNTSGRSWNSSWVAGASFLLGNGHVPDSPTITNVRLAVGPSPGTTVYLAYLHLTNESSSSARFDWTKSTDNGTTWGQPVSTGVRPNLMLSSAPDWFYNGSVPVLAADEGSGSSHRGHLYMVWNDNRTPGPGTPGVAFSSDSGSGWSPPVFLSTNDTAETRYFAPTVGVAPSGRVWVAYYATNILSGTYRLLGRFSDDGGTTWSAQFPVADAESSPFPTIYAGGPPELVATTAGTYVAWTDCRSLACPSDGTTSYVPELGQTSTFLALLRPVWFNATVPNVTASVDFGDLSSSYVLPLRTAWGVDGSITVSVPRWVATPNPSRVGEFAGFVGATNVTNTTATFTYRAGDLSAQYSTYWASFIAGTVRPLLARTELAVDGTSVPLSPGADGSTFRAMLPGGRTYPVGVSAPKYAPFTALANTTALRTTWLNVTLLGEVGWISGRVTPNASWAMASLTVNGSQVVPVSPSDGAFNVSELWGGYWLNGSAPGYGPFGEYVTVRAGATSWVLVELLGAYINGSVVPAEAVLSIDGGNVPVTNGNFSAPVAAGPHDVRATLSGYVGYESRVTVAPGGESLLRIVLSPLYGTIRGTVVPTNATVLLDGRPLATTSGRFVANETARPVPYNVTARAPGYSTDTRWIVVRSGATSYANLSLKDYGWINGTLAPTTAAVRVNGLPVPVVAGRFNVTEPASPNAYNVSFCAVGQYGGWVAAPVAPGRVTYVDLPAMAQVDASACRGTGGSPPPRILAFFAREPVVTFGSPVHFVATVRSATSFEFRYSGLPPGCTSANTPFLNCTPTAWGSFTVTVTVVGTGGAVAWATAPLDVVAATDLSSPTRLPPALGLSATGVGLAIAALAGVAAGVAWVLWRNSGPPARGRTPEPALPPTRVP